MKIELTTTEAQTLVNLLDIAVKSVGLSASEQAIYFLKKIQTAAQEPVSDAPTPDSV